MTALETLEHRRVEQARATAAERVGDAGEGGAALQTSGDLGPQGGHDLGIVGGHIALLARVAGTVEEERRRIARVVGLGAVKYADLLSNRQSDYVFSWERMLSLTGNTAPYLQYAYARITSIFRKGGLTPEAARQAACQGLMLQNPEELALGRYLLDFGLVLESVAEDYRPNYLCNYLFELAGRFTRFYESCPVLKAPEPTRSVRLYLCEITARVLQLGLDALGVEVLEQM